MRRIEATERSLDYYRVSGQFISVSSSKITLFRSSKINVSSQPITFCFNTVTFMEKDRCIIHNGLSLQEAIHKRKEIRRMYMTHPSFSS